MGNRVIYIGQVSFQSLIALYSLIKKFNFNTELKLLNMLSYFVFLSKKQLIGKSSLGE